MKATNNLGLKKIELTDSPPDITVQDENWDKIDKYLYTAVRYQKAGGTATAITLSEVTLEDGFQKTFIVTTNNNGVATKINNKNLYKPGGTSTPTLTAGKAVTIWYDASGDCFFIKASAEGNAIAENVLASKTFSNDDDTGIVGAMTNNGPETSETVNLTSHNQEYTIEKGYHSGLRKIKAVISGLVASVIKAGTIVGGVVGTFTSDATAIAANILTGKSAYINGNKVDGTMVDRGAINQALAINGTYTIPIGYHNGSGKVTQAISTKGAAIITPGTTDQTIASGQYLSGAQTIKGDANLIPANILSGKTIFGVAGALAQGRKFATGTSSITLQDLGNFQTVGSSESEFPGMYKLTVTGLTFKPNHIIIHCELPGNTQSVLTVYKSEIGPGGLFSENCMTSNYQPGRTSIQSFHLKANALSAYVNATGFCLPLSGVSNPTSWAIKWYAYE